MGRETRGCGPETLGREARRPAQDMGIEAGWEQKAVWLKALREWFSQETVRLGPTARSTRSKEASRRRRMIAHVVLFQPRADLSATDREAFAASFERALTSIPQVRRARVGERVNLGRFYDQQNARDFSHVAVIEFDSEADLRAYLEHPAHRELGTRFYQAAEAALVYDFALSEGTEAGNVFKGK